MRTVEQDDPSLTKLEIGGSGGIFQYGPPDLSRLGTVIADNTHLVELEVKLDENVVIEVTDETLLNGLKQTHPYKI